MSSASMTRAVSCALAVAALSQLAAPRAGAQSLTPATYQSLPYRYIGPPSNRINAVAGVAGDPNVIYAGATAGGIFKSIDGGLHFPARSSIISR